VGLDIAKVCPVLCCLLSDFEAGSARRAFMARTRPQEPPRHLQFRTDEIGIRMALGAHPREVVKLVVKDGAKLAVAGLVIGVIAAATVTRFMKSLFFGVASTDPVTFVCVLILLMMVALLACYIPARRAARVDPTVALRYE
jgi:ABC-type antimicrobial peptide transport system permease subunit